MLISFQEHRLLIEGFGKIFADEIKRIFSAFDTKPQFAHDGKTISFKNLTEMDKDSIVAGLLDHFKKYTKLKTDIGNIATFRTPDDKFIEIKSPTKEGKKLVHGCLEGPEHSVYVRGVLIDKNVIELPDYWVNLVDEKTITGLL